MSQCFIIRTECLSDEEAIADITVAAFMTLRHGTRTERFIIASLRRKKALFLSLVAEVENRVVGHIAFSPISIADGSAGWYGLGPLAVAPLFQRHGVGLSLVHSGLTVLRERGAQGCVVLGSPGYYSRFGFVADPDLTYQGPPPEFFMALHFTDSHPRGEVTYHEAFNAEG